LPLLNAHACMHAGWHALSRHLIDYILLKPKAPGQTKISLCTLPEEEEEECLLDDEQVVEDSEMSVQHYALFKILKELVSGE